MLSWLHGVLTCSSCGPNPDSARRGRRRQQGDDGEGTEFARLLDEDDRISLEESDLENAEVMSNEQIQKITSLVQQQVRLEEETTQNARRELDDLELGDDDDVDDIQRTPHPRHPPPPPHSPAPLSKGMPLSLPPREMREIAVPPPSITGGLSSFQASPPIDIPHTSPPRTLTEPPALDLGPDFSDDDLENFGFAPLLASSSGPDN